MNNYPPNSYDGPVEPGYDNDSNTQVSQGSSNISDPQGYNHNYGNPASPYPNGDQGLSTMDSRSIYVGQVDYGTSPEELQNFFQQCGQINRVTILCDKYTGHPKGYGFIEFAEEASANHALSLDQALFRGRQLKVTPKRANVPGMIPRGRGRGRGRGGGGVGGRFGAGGGRGYAPPPLHPPFYNGPMPPQPPPPGYYGGYQ